MKIMRVLRLKFNLAILGCHVLETVIVVVSMEEGTEIEGVADGVGLVVEEAVGGVVVVEEEAVEGLEVGIEVVV